MYIKGIVNDFLFGVVAIVGILVVCIFGGIMTMLGNIAGFLAIIFIGIVAISLVWDGFSNKIATWKYRRNIKKG